MASLQKSSELVNITWRCRVATLTAKVREGRYFRTSSSTHSKASNNWMEDGNLALWLRRTWRDALTSPPSLLLAPPGTKGGRIMVTKNDSLAREAVEGYAFLQRREVPPPAWCEIVKLSEEEDSLSEAPWRVSEEGEPSMEMTYWSIRVVESNSQSHYYPCPRRNHKLKTLSKNNTLKVKKANEEEGESQIVNSKARKIRVEKAEI